MGRRARRHRARHQQADPPQGVRATKTGARAKLDALRRELADTGAAGPLAGTVASAVADWVSHLPARIKDPTSVAIVHRHASRITAELGRIPVKKLPARDVERLLGTMAAEGLSACTIRGCSRCCAGRWTGPSATG